MDVGMIGLLLTGLGLIVLFGLYLRDRRRLRARRRTPGRDGPPDLWTDGNRGVTGDLSGGSDGGGGSGTD